MQQEPGSPESEELLWIEFQRGSEEAFAGIYNLYFRLLYNYACKFTSDKDLVKDAIHDVFVKLWDRRETTKSITSLKYYLLKALRNRVFDVLSERNKMVFEEEQLTEDRFEFVLPQESLLIAQQLTDEQQQQIVTALNTLTPRQKEAIFLRFYNNLSYEEIACIMSLSVDSCYNLISKGLGILKKDMTRMRTSMLLVLLQFHDLPFSDKGLFTASAPVAAW